MDPDSDLRRQLALTGLSYADWESATVEIRRAADLASNSGLIDAAHLVRAGEIADAIDEEIRMLDADRERAISEEVARQLVGVRDRLTVLRDEIRRATRKLQGLT